MLNSMLNDDEIQIFIIFINVRPTFIYRYILKNL